MYVNFIYVTREVLLYSSIAQNKNNLDTKSRRKKTRINQYLREHPFNLKGGGGWGG